MSSLSRCNFIHVEHARHDVQPVNGPLAGKQRALNLWPPGIAGHRDERRRVPVRSRQGVIIVFLGPEVGLGSDVRRRDRGRQGAHLRSTPLAVRHGPRHLLVAALPQLVRAPPPGIVVRTEIVQPLPLDLQELVQHPFLKQPPGLCEPHVHFLAPSQCSYCIFIRVRFLSRSRYIHPIQGILHDTLVLALVLSRESNLLAGFREIRETRRYIFWSRPD